MLFVAAQSGGAIAGAALLYGYVFYFLRKWFLYLIQARFSGRDEYFSISPYVIQKYFIVSASAEKNTARRIVCVFVITKIDTAMKYVRT